MSPTLMRRQCTACTVHCRAAIATPPSDTSTHLEQHLFGRSLVGLSSTRDRHTVLEMEETMEERRMSLEGDELLTAAEQQQVSSDEVS